MVLLLSSLVLSGCTSADSANSADTSQSAQPEPSVDASTGAIQGFVTDDSLSPIAGAEVGVQELGATSRTDGTGRFVLNGLAEGSYAVAVQKLGYSAAAKRIDVRAGEITEASFQLVALAIEESYHVSQSGSGRFGCGFALRPGVALAGCAATYGTPLDGTDKFRVDFHLSAENISKVKSLVLESEWRSTQAMSGGFDMYWETYQEWGAGTAYTEDVRRVARAFGNSPLKAYTDDEEMEDNFKEWNKAGETPPKYCVKDGKCSIYARAFPYAGTLGPSAPADLSVYIDQPFTHWVTEFFGEYAPEDFTALQDA